MMLFKKLIVLPLLVITFGIHAQNQHQPQKWEKIHSPFATILYQQNQQKDAQRIANTIAYIQKNNYQSIGYQYHPVPIILRANTAESNGFVTYSPFRSEFFNTSPPGFNSLGSTDWLTTLSIHEYRHVQQFLNHKKGATNVLYYLFGETGWALGSILSIPNWYFEGDAVIMETATTLSGRGRIPSFTALQRALHQQNTLYSYAKIRNGSFKNLVPSHYQTGYQMLNYYRNHFDASKLGTIASKAAAYTFPFYGFSYQLKKETGLSTRKLYQKTAAENQQKWQLQRDSLQVKTYPILTKKSSKVTQYHYPQLMENGNIIALKSTFDKLPTFYQINKAGKEFKITPTITNVDHYFSYQNQQIVFTGISLHPRYNNTSYNNVYLYHIPTKKRTQLTHNKKFFSPSFNKDNSKIIVVQQENNQSSLVILNAKNGNILKEIPIHGTASRPLFMEEHGYVFLKQQNHKVAIFTMDKNLQETQITPWTSHVISRIQLYGTSVCYSASFNGIDNIYISPLNGSKTIQQLTNAKIGALQPFATKDTLYFIEPTSNGSHIATTKICPTPTTFTEPIEMNWNLAKTVAFEGGSILHKIDSIHYPSQKKKSFLEDLKFHDWNLSASNQKLEANITATNLLNDFSLNTFTSVYTNESESVEIGAKASYKKWFPSLNLEASYTHRGFNHSLVDFQNNVQTGIYRTNIIHLLPSIGIPLLQTKENYTTSFYSSIGYDFLQTHQSTFTTTQPKQKTVLDEKKQHFLNASVSFSSVRNRALQHISPRAGLESFNELNMGLYNQKAIYFNSLNRLFLPGLFANHNLMVTYAYQRNDEWIQADSFLYARGYKVFPALQSQYASIQYQLPIFYPDYGIAGITYFKRIRANLFADFSKIATAQNVAKQQQTSFGLEVISDQTFFNIKEAKIGIGYRASYLVNNGPNHTKNSVVHGIFINTPLR